MNPLAQTIPEIQDDYSGETDPSVFRDLLEQEKSGKKRKVLKRWLRERIKSLEETKSYPTAHMMPPTVKSPKDSITGIPIIG